MKKYVMMSLLSFVFASFGFTSLGFAKGPVQKGNAAKTTEKAIEKETDDKSLDQAPPVKKDDDEDEDDREDARDEAAADAAPIDWFQISFQPGKALNTGAGFEFQFRLGKHFSIGPMISYTEDTGQNYYSSFYSSTSPSVYNEKTSGPSYGVRSVFYFKDMNRSTAYLSVFLEYAKLHVVGTEDYFSSSSKKTTGDYSQSAIGFTGGFQWKWSDCITFNVGGGLRARNKPDTVTLTSTSGSHEYSLDTIDNLFNVFGSFVLDLGVGYTF